jgi:hypothetical protein
VDAHGVCTLHMGDLEVTKGGTVETVDGTVQNSSVFRRGVMGDWANHLSPETARRIDAITEDKFQGSNLNYHLIMHMVLPVLLLLCGMFLLQVQ